MAFFETTRSDGLTRRGQSSFFNTLLARIAAWNDLRVTRKALLGLSDHELNDIGLCRGDIEDGAAFRN